MSRNRTRANRLGRVLCVAAIALSLCLSIGLRVLATAHAEETADVVATEVAEDTTSSEAAMSTVSASTDEGDATSSAESATASSSTEEAEVGAGAGDDDSASSDEEDASSASASSSDDAAAASSGDSAAADSENGSAVSDSDAAAAGDASAESAEDATTSGTTSDSAEAASADEDADTEAAAASEASAASADGEDGIATASDEATTEDEDTATDADVATASVASSYTQVSGSFTPSSGNAYQLTANATISSQVQLSSGTITIDLNGYALTCSKDFMIYGGTTLNLEDTSESGSGTVTCSSYFVEFYGGGTFNMYGGTIYAAKGYSCIWFEQSSSSNPSTFNMYGGIISGANQTSGPQYGGAVYMYTNQGNNVFNMYAGTITGCSVTQYGGGVYVGSSMSGYTSTFNFYGGTISNCSAPYGGGVYIDNGGIMTIAGGEGITGVDGYSCYYKACITGCTSSSSNSEAIYVFGTLNVQGVIDIDGTVYLMQNNWSGGTSAQVWIHVTGELLVIGWGYIDIDSAYPDSNAIVYGNTVVVNDTWDSTTQSYAISATEFYAYSAFFINTTKNLTVSAGYDPDQYESSELKSLGSTYTDISSYPSDWPSQSDTNSYTYYAYKDVYGQTKYIQASAGSGYVYAQSRNYLIYTTNTTGSSDTTSEDDLITYYTIQLVKFDASNVSTSSSDSSSTTAATAYAAGTLNTLDGATFTLLVPKGSLMADGEADDGTTTSDRTYYSGSTGEYADYPGVTYIYDSQSATISTIEKAQVSTSVSDGYYTLSEASAPSGYTARTDGTTITISGATVTVNGITISSSSWTLVNSTYGDYAMLVGDEIVILYGDTASVDDATLAITKYSSSVAEGNELSGATFALYAATATTAEDGTVSYSVVTDAAAVATGTSGSGGTLTLYSASDSSKVYTLAAGTAYKLVETSAPSGYTAVGAILIVVSSAGVPTFSWWDSSAANSGGFTSATATTSSGAYILNIWDALSGAEGDDDDDDDEEDEEATWALALTKYGTTTQVGNELAGATFALYQGTDTSSAAAVKLASATSADGSDESAAKGSVTFEDEDGNAIALEVDTTYTIVETAAPQGYALADKLTVVVSADESAESGYTVAVALGGTELGTSSSDSSSGSTSYYTVTYDEDSSTYTIAIALTDSVLYELPESAGRGILPLWCGGVALMLAAGAGYLCLARLQPVDPGDPRRRTKGGNARPPVT